MGVWQAKLIGLSWELNDGLVTEKWLWLNPNSSANKNSADKSGTKSKGDKEDQKATKGNRKGVNASNGKSNRKNGSP